MDFSLLSAIHIGPIDYLFGTFFLTVAFSVAWMLFWDYDGPTLELPDELCETTEFETKKHPAA